MNRTLVRPEPELAVPESSHKVNDHSASQKPVYPVEPKTVVAPSLRRVYVPASERLADLAGQLDASTTALRESVATYDQNKGKVDHTISDLEKQIAELEARLAELRAQRAAEVAKGTALERFQQAILIGEGAVEGIATRSN